MNKQYIFLMSVAVNAAQLSSAVRLKVGGVITDSEYNIVAYGYNGTPHGFDNRCECESSDGNLVTNKNVVHCEANLIAHAARRGISINKGSVFLTHSPCESCAALLVQSGIQNVFYREQFRTHDYVYGMFGNRLNFTQMECP